MWSKVAKDFSFPKTLIFRMTMYLPSDPDMLVSAINMMLRNGEYSDLEDLCACADRDREELTSTLLAHGYSFDGKQFKSTHLE